MSTDKQLIYEQYQLINEIVLSKANTDRFEKQYNTNHHGAAVNIIKFNGCQAYLKNKDIFGYESLDQLRSALEQAAAEMRKRTIKLGGPEALKKRLEELMKEQKEWHGGGNKWIGAGGSSPAKCPSPPGALSNSP